MKKSFLTIALAVAAMPMMFAAQNPPASTPKTDTSSKPAATAPVKKHVKKVNKKNTPKTNGAAVSTSTAKPAVTTPAPAAASKPSK